MFVDTKDKRISLLPVVENISSRLIPLRETDENTWFRDREIHVSRDVIFHKSCFLIMQGEEGKKKGDWRNS